MKYVGIGVVIAALLALNFVAAQTNPSASTCHYEIVGVSGQGAFLLNPCTGDSWYYDSGVSYDGPNEPATWKRIVKE